MPKTGKKKKKIKEWYHRQATQKFGGKYQKNQQEWKVVASGQKETVWWGPLRTAASHDTFLCRTI